MTRDEAIAQAPSGRKTYWFALIFCTPVALTIPWDVFARDNSLFGRIVDVVWFCIFLLAAVQSWERLFRPERAVIRSRSWTGQQRGWIERTNGAALVVAVGLFFIAMIAQYSGLLPRATAQDMKGLSWVLLVLYTVLRDLIGKRNFYSASRRPPRPNPIQWTQLAPIHSDHWGNRGPMLGP